MINVKVYQEKLFCLYLTACSLVMSEKPPLTREQKQGWMKGGL